MRCRGASIAGPRSAFLWQRERTGGSGALRGSDACPRGLLPHRVHDGRRGPPRTLGRGDSAACEETCFGVSSGHSEPHAPDFPDRNDSWSSNRPHFRSGRCSCPAARRPSQALAAGSPCAGVFEQTECRMKDGVCVPQAAAFYPAQRRPRAREPVVAVLRMTASARHPDN